MTAVNLEFQIGRSHRAPKAERQRQSQSSMLLPGEERVGGSPRVERIAGEVEDPFPGMLV